MREPTRPGVETGSDPSAPWDAGTHRWFDDRPPGWAREGPSARRVGCGHGRPATARPGRNARRGRAGGRRGTPGVGTAPLPPSLRLCGLPRARRARQHVVVGDAPVSGRPWSLVGEAPGADEDAGGRSSGGRRRSLDQLLAEAGLTGRSAPSSTWSSAVPTGQPDAEGHGGRPLQRLAAPADRTARPPGDRRAGAVRRRSGS